jgi:predicted DNA-binding transcriptional regulator AlpA
MISNEQKAKIVEVLLETPIIHHACKKAGVSRATFYRLCHSDKKFKKEVDRALQEGRWVINDVAESMLLKKINEGHFGATKYWLGHNDPRYATREQKTKERWADATAD